MHLPFNAFDNYALRTSVSSTSSTYAVQWSAVSSVFCTCLYIRLCHVYYIQFDCLLLLYFMFMFICRARAAFGALLLAHASSDLAHASQAWAHLFSSARRAPCRIIVVLLLLLALVTHSSNNANNSSNSNNHSSHNNTTLHEAKQLKGTRCALTAPSCNLSQQLSSFDVHAAQTCAAPCLLRGPTMHCIRQIGVSSCKPRDT